MKKQILQEKAKTLNRIQLFKKTSQKMIRQKQRQIEVDNKKENIKKDPLFTKLSKQKFVESGEHKRKHQYLKSLGDIEKTRILSKNNSLIIKVQSRREDKKRN